jgi:hypothetical protein
MSHRVTSTVFPIKIYFKDVATRPRVDDPLSLLQNSDVDVLNSLLPPFFHSSLDLVMVGRIQCTCVPCPALFRIRTMTIHSHCSCKSLILRFEIDDSDTEPGELVVRRIYPWMLLELSGKCDRCVRNPECTVLLKESN